VPQQQCQPMVTGMASLSGLLGRWWWGEGAASVMRMLQSHVLPSIG
jgi:hypothetical protein